MSATLSFTHHAERHPGFGMPRTIGHRVFIALTCTVFVLFLTSGAQLGAALELFGFHRSAAAVAAPVVRKPTIDLSTITVDDKAQLIVEGQEAQQRNALIPLSRQPLGHVTGFNLVPAAGGTYATALKCLAQAVYYEAAVEPLQGRRAVAQVVLNRMRHPGYPDTVCGVVYQGAERATGCQFSFTCDGSLLRQPMAGPWRQAEDVARAALAGYVEPSVGTATYYHADYVLPKWAFQLDKIEQIGRHIFYRLPGRWGGGSAFLARYGGFERIPALDLASLRARAAERPQNEENLVPGLTVPPLVSDRHAESDVGGRLDVTKQWRLSIPDPVAASSRYRQAIGAEAGGPAEGSAKWSTDVAAGSGEVSAQPRASVGAAQLDNRPVG